jgi:hypothetical protein
LLAIKPENMPNKAQLEVLWWLFTALLAGIILLPIYLSVPHFAFWPSGILFIIAFITLTRYIFLLPTTFLVERQNLKIVLVFLCIPLVFHLIQEINYFQTFLDEEGPEAIVGELPFARQGAMIGAAIFPFRLLISYWHYRNRSRRR